MSISHKQNCSTGAINIMIPLANATTSLKQGVVVVFIGGFIARTNLEPSGKLLFLLFSRFSTIFFDSKI